MVEVSINERSSQEASTPCLNTIINQNGFQTVTQFMEESRRSSARDATNTVRFLSSASHSNAIHGVFGGVQGFSHQKRYYTPSSPVSPRNSNTNFQTVLRDLANDAELILSRRSSEAQSTGGLSRWSSVSDLSESSVALSTDGKARLLDTVRSAQPMSSKSEDSLPSASLDVIDWPTVASLRYDVAPPSKGGLYPNGHLREIDGSNTRILTDSHDDHTFRSDKLVAHNRDDADAGVHSVMMHSQTRSISHTSSTSSISCLSISMDLDDEAVGPMMRL